MWVRVMAKLLAVFGFYAIVIARIGANMPGKGGGSYTLGVIELATVTILFVIAAVFILTRRPRARPPVE
jgi:Mn2+/Fe2+ NRAMP family transporter